jgi:hypothetical protein
MAHLKYQPGFVGQLLQLGLEQPHARTVRAAAIGGDEQRVRPRITNAANRLKPTAYRVDGEFSRVMVDPKADPAGIRCQIIDAVWCHLAEFLVGEVTRLDAIRAACGTVIAAAVLILADQLLLLGIDGNNGLASRLQRIDLGVEMIELCIAVGIVAAFFRLAI